MKTGRTYSCSIGKDSLFARSFATIFDFLSYFAEVPEGANLFPVIANWPDTRVDHWVTLLKARAIENQAFTIGVNRVGNDPKFNYPGHSVIFDPHGTQLSIAGMDAGCISADVYPETATEWRDQFRAIDDMKM